MEFFLEIDIVRKISVITIVKNDYQGLNKTIKSVQDSGLQCEHLIIDGSNQKLEKLNCSNNLVYIWGVDYGISDAFNKGVSLATSEYVLFLNAGDELLDKAALLIQEVLVDKRVDAAWFSVLRISEGRRKTIYRPRIKYLYYAMSAPHQGLILRRKVFSEIGGFPYQKYSMDHYLALKLISRSPKYKISCFYEPIATYPSGGHSSKGGNLPFIYNVWNVLRINPLGLPIAIVVNFYLMAKSTFSKLKVSA